MGSVVIEREERMVIIRVGGVSREGVRLVRIESVCQTSVEQGAGAGGGERVMEPKGKAVSIPLGSD